MAKRNWRSFNRRTLNQAFKVAASQGRSNGLPTPNYLANIYNDYREQIRSKFKLGFQNQALRQQDKNAMVLEKFLNALKYYSASGNLQGFRNLSQWSDLEEVLSIEVLLEVINNLKQVNPGLFNHLQFTFVAPLGEKDIQGKVWEQKLAEVSATLEATLAGKDNGWWNNNKTIQIGNHWTGALGDNTIDLISPVENISTQLGLNLYRQSAHNQAINQAKQNIYFTKGSEKAKGKLKRLLDQEISIQSAKNKQIKIDATGGWILNEDYSATATIPQILIDAFKDATFSAKSYQKGKYIEVGGTSAYKIFMAVASGDYQEKHYRYCRMLNCLHHHSGFHDDSKTYIYRIRALYELTGANQKLGEGQLVDSVIRDLIDNPTGAKYLVINNPTAQYTGIKVIPTSQIAGAVEEYIFFNKKYSTLGEFLDANQYGLSVHQALDSKIVLNMNYSELYKHITQN